MSVFKRANWHSGLTYEQTCPNCKSVIRYTDFNLDYRPWYPDGFVYCGKCEKPLRHSENFAINANKSQANCSQTQTEGIIYCSKCGKQLKRDDNFCSKCGTKVDNCNS